MSRTVSYEEVKDIVNHPEVRFFDVRTVKEVEDTALIPGSTNIPINQVEEAFTVLDDAEFTKRYGTTKPAKDSPIVFTCKIGKRAKTAADKLESVGYTNVKYYEGSWLDWASKQQQD